MAGLQRATLQTSIYTADGGNTWNCFDLTKPQVMYGIAMGTAAQPFLPVLWTTGQGGAIFRSMDDNLSRQPRTTFAGMAIIGSICFDKTFPVGWAATANGYILKTSDAGDNWDKIMPGVTSPLSSMCFTDTLRGFIAGDSGVLRRTTECGQIRDVSFTDSLYGWCVVGRDISYIRLSGVSTGSGKSPSM